MDFKKHILDNGLAIIGEVNKAAESAAVGFFVKTGARDETSQINGVSHFLEHMLFKGTETLSALQVNEAFDRTGAKFNAFTSEENTVYYAAVLPEYLPEVTQLWCELMRPSLRDDDFDMEKNVIKEEISMYMDMPHFDVMDKCRALHFGSHACGNSVLGSNESIDTLTAEQMRGYFQSRYAPNNITLVCAGDFDFEQLCRLAETKCGKWETKKSPRVTEFCNGTTEKQRQSKANLVREHICLISPSVAFQDERMYAAMLGAMIVGDDVGSRFFWKLIDTALAETASMCYEAMDGVGAFYTYIRTAPETAEKVMDIIGEILCDLAKGGVSENELQKAKNKVLSTITIKNEIPMGRLVDLGFNWTYLQQWRTIAKEIQLVKAVSCDDIADLFKEFDPANFTQLSLGPEKTQ